MAERILLVEDEPINQRVGEATLRHLGFSVEMAADGGAAVEAASRITYRAILMDCQLPVLDGFEAIVAIRRAEDAAHRTQIISLTASDLDVERKRCLAAGADAFLTKPLRADELALVLDRWTPGDAHAGSHAGATARPVLDPAVVERLQRLGGSAGVDLLAELILLFVAEADERIAQLRETIAQHDAEATIRSAHALRGASANLGANELVDLCRLLEHDGGSGDRAEGVAIVDALVSQLDRIRSAAGAFSATDATS